MWPYASSFKHLLIEDHKHYAYVRLYIQEILSEASLSVSSSTLSIPQSLLQSSYLERVTSNIPTGYSLPVRQTYDVPTAEVVYVTTKS